MNVNKTRGIRWSVLISIMLLAVPMWVLADQSATQPDIDHIIQMRQLQNQATMLQNMQANSVQVLPHLSRNALCV